MNSEKVKEIKEILKKRIENINPWETHALEYHKGLLDLINELESENKSLQDLCNKTYEDLTKEIDRLESENEKMLDSCKNCHYRKDLEIANGHAKELKDRIAELEKEIKENAFYSKGYAQGIKNTYEIVVPDKLKQFAERLKDKVIKYRGVGCGVHPLIFDIDEILKEFIKGEEVEE